MPIVQYTTAEAVHIDSTLRPGEWAKVLCILRDTSRAVTEDLVTLQQSFGQNALPQTLETRQFIESCQYFREGLLLPPFTTAKAELVGELSTKVTRMVPPVTVQELLETVERSLKRMTECLASLLAKAKNDWGLLTILEPPSQGSQIPTASPYHLCHLAILLSAPGSDVIYGGGPSQDVRFHFSTQ